MTDGVQIDIYGPISKISGSYPKAAVRLVTSYPVEGAQFSPSFRKKMWDGRKHLFRQTTSTFPTGLLSLVKEACELAGEVVTLVDHRTPSAPLGGSYDLIGVSMTGKYDYQLDAAVKAVEAKQGVLRMATNSGKCLGLHTPVRMHDGSVKQAQDILVGDKLMGPDSLPRWVKSTCRGTGPMYQVVQKRGSSYTCNDVHMLTLQDCRKENTNQIVDIPLNKYLLEDTYYKHCFKHFSAGVEYPAQAQEIDPYFIGLWLGDGTKALKTVAVTTEDSEIVTYLEKFAASWGCYVSEDGKKHNKASTYHLSTKKGQANPLLIAMRVLLPDLRIPGHYLLASREQRLALLAGLLDSDGHYDATKGVYEITLKQRDLIDDVYYLCRSLGYGVAPAKKKVVLLPGGSKNLPDGRYGTYWRLHIRGTSPTACPPVLLLRKRATYSPKKEATRTCFKVESLGVGEYAGFTLDGDGRFLLEDYTVTHNTEVACAIVKYLDLPTLFMVTTRELLYQARDRFMLRLGCTEAEIGIIGDGHWQPGTRVTIATVATLEARIETKECQEFLQSQEVLFVDECHHLGSDTVFEVCTLCPANYRFGLSGTPMDRTDGANLRLLGAVGEVIVDVPNKFLVERGISARAEIIFTKITAPVIPRKTPYASAYKQGVVDNPNLLVSIVDWVKVFHSQGLGTLVLCEEIAHGKSIDEALWTATGGQFVPHQFIYGEEDTDTRRNALKDFSEGRLPVLVASCILDEGVDVPTIDALILAGSRKSRIKTMQRLGRGLRGSKLIVVEFSNFCSDYLLRHSLTRYQDYKQEDCFSIHQSGPNEELVKRLWKDKP